MTARNLHFQHTVSGNPERVFEALTNTRELTQWFCEHAAVDLSEGRYDFWGRYTPGNPDRVGGSHSITQADQDRLLAFNWSLRGGRSTVTFRLRSEGEHTRIGVWHDALPQAEAGSPADFSMSDFWFLVLENLHRHLDGRPARWCDFSLFDGRKPLHLQTEMEGEPAAAWEALIRPKELNRWFASDARVNPSVGGAWDMGWGDEGAFKILELEAGKRLTLEWPIAGAPTVVTWVLEDMGGKRTRLTLTQSGFAPDYNPRGERAGWSSFVCWLTSVVEYGPSWKPPIRRLSPDEVPMYPRGVWEQQETLAGEESWNG